MLAKNSSALFLGFCLATTALANGSGYNGPDLEGEAIPAEADRTYSVEDIKRATATCQRDLGKKMYRLVMKREYDGSEPKEFFDRRDLAGYSLIKFTGWTNFTDKEGCRLVVNQTHSHTSRQPVPNDLTVYFDLKKCNARPEVLSRSLRLVTDYNRVPVIDFSSRIEREYDELGQIISEREIVVRLRVTEQPGESKIHKLKNQTTGGTTEIEFDSAEYKTCLSSELERGAE